MKSRPKKYYGIENTVEILPNVWKYVASQIKLRCILHVFSVLKIALFCFLHGTLAKQTF